MSKVFSWVKQNVVLCIAAIAAIPIASPNNIIHIYSYVAGLIVGFLNSPAHA